MFDNLKYKYNKSKLKKNEFDFIFDKNISTDEYIVLDTETTGLNPKKDEILSIGAVKVKKNKIITSESFEIFIKPINKISDESIKIHHILPQDIQNGTTINNALEQLLYFVGNKTIVGYYIWFDVSILNRFLKQYIGSILPNKTIELSSMYYERYRKKSAHEFVDLKFDTIIDNLDIPILGKHDALNDSIMSAMIFLKLINIPIYKGAFS
ncbi:MAG: 3'-5' exonuclease [Epsilonproteobacteria bacterium]|nr:MAG: 3'-5' exonuclease [Campylobacterota bacterium]